MRKCSLRRDCAAHTPAFLALCVASAAQVARLAERTLGPRLRRRSLQRSKQFKIPSCSGSGISRRSSGRSIHPLRLPALHTSRRRRPPPIPPGARSRASRRPIRATEAPPAHSTVARRRALPPWWPTPGPAEYIAEWCCGVCMPSFSSRLTVAVGSAPTDVPQGQARGEGGAAAADPDGAGQRGDHQRGPSARARQRRAQALPARAMPNPRRPALSRSPWPSR